MDRRSAKTRILFVDDEPRVLEGIQRMMRGMREEWDMVFAPSGPEALAIMQKEPCEVVVSDMRMPGMDGAKLLSEIKNLYPETVRIILSGHSDSAFVMKSIRAAHQYLHKPCDPAVLKSVVKKACTLRNLLADEKLKGMIGRMETLPSLPSLYSEIMDELQSPKASLQQVGRIISKDVGMTAKILQLVNSAFFGLKRRISDPTQAVSLLGLDTIKALVLTTEIFAQFPQGKAFPLPLDLLWRHSFHTGILAKAIAEKEGQNKGVAEDAFMAGLLHDLGKLILAVNWGDSYLGVHRLAEEKKILLWQAERDHWGFSHSEVGAYLVGLWGLPDSILEGLAFHHCPGRYPGEGFHVPLAVHVANALQHQQGNPVPERNPRLEEEYFARCGFLDRLGGWEECCREMMHRGGDDDEPSDSFRGR